MKIETLDHVALWVGDRDELADFLSTARHARDRAHRQVHAGRGDARRGKLTLFAAEGDREPGRLARIGLRVFDLDEALAELPPDLRSSGRTRAASSSRARRASASRSSRRTTGVDYDLDHVALRVADPEATFARARRARLRRRGRPPPGRRRLRRARAGRVEEPERPLLNHLGLLVESAEQHIRGSRRARARDRRRRRRGEHVRGLRLGPRRHQARVRRAQAELLARLDRRGARPRRRRSRHGRARRRRAGAGAAAPRSSSTRRATAPGGSMLLSSGFVWRYRDWERFRAECPGGDPALQRLVWERPRRGPRLARVARRAGGRAGDRQPAHDRAPLRPARLTELLAARAGDVRLGEPLASFPTARRWCWRRAASRATRSSCAVHVTPEADAARPAREPLEHGRRPPARPRGRALPSSAGMDEFYGRNSRGRRRRIAPERLRRRWPSSTPATRRSRTPTASAYETRTWSEIDVVQWTARQPGARARYSSRTRRSASASATARSPR